MLCVIYQMSNWFSASSWRLSWLLGIRSWTYGDKDIFLFCTFSRPVKGEVIFDNHQRPSWWFLRTPRLAFFSKQNWKCREERPPWRHISLHNEYRLFFFQRAQQWILQSDWFLVRPSFPISAHGRGNAFVSRRVHPTFVTIFMNKFRFASRAAFLICSF